MNLTSKQRAYLRGLANHTEALFQVGKSSLTPELTAAVQEAFNTREIIKLSVLKNCQDNQDTLEHDAIHTTKQNACHDDEHERQLIDDPLQEMRLDNDGIERPRCRLSDAIVRRIHIYLR